MPDAQPDAQYDPDAIFQEHGPLHPGFMADAIQGLMRAYPLENQETRPAQQRHLQSALVALAATNPRDPIEVMLAVQALSAYQAACACWRIGMNSRDPSKERPRHIAAAASAARTFDTMLRAIERRQAKPLSVPAGRPPSRRWSRHTTARTLDQIAERVRALDSQPAWDPPHPPNAQPVDPSISWSPEDLSFAETIFEQDRIDQENADLDIANTEGILPCGGMILMEHPTPQQKAYMGRRLRLMYQREYEEGLRNGIDEMPKIRGIRPGDKIP